jgi:hypothetical protein
MYQQSLFHRDLSWESSAQVLAVRWNGFQPELVCTIDSDDEIRRFSFSSDLEFEVDTGKHCIGTWEDGKHVPCPVNARVTRFSCCDSCAQETIPDQRCIFEPRCQGDSCLVNGRLGESIPFCSRPHSLYLANYHDRMKIGMTASDRISDRLIEQGADAYIRIATTENRFDAREMEKALSRKHGIRQSFNAMEILRMTTVRIDQSTLHRESRGLIMKMMADDIKPALPLTILDNYPIILPLRSVPKETSTSGLHIGKTIGMKGRFLYYDHGGPRALNLGDLPSRTIRFNPSSFL